MTTSKFDVVAIGNAIVDIFGRCDDAYLASHGCPKGHMRLVDDATISALYAGMGPATEISGGSAANTAAGIASLGGKSAFIGKIADDEFGRIFAHDIRASGVAFENTPRKGNGSTSRSLILVTPDGERTMNTLLGISTTLDDAELSAAMIEDAAILYLEGYLFDPPAAKAAFRSAIAVARKAGRKVALSLSDSFCVDRHRAEFNSLISDGIDIVFANELEITSLYEVTTFEEAAAAAARHMPMAVITGGAKGAVVLAKGRRIETTADHVAKVVDTTGAGDLFAAGFLFGLARERYIDICGRLGALAAAEIISHVGARPATRLARLAKHHGLV